MRRSITAIRTIVILLFVLFPLFTFTAANTGGSDALYLEKEISFTANPDGSWEKEYRHLLKLETYYAVNRTCGETFIAYNPQYQVLNVLKSETTMKDGRKVSSPANAFNEVLPAAAHYFSHYAHLREMVVTHTGLERGAVIDLHYRLSTKPGFMPYFSGREFITDHFPIRRLVLKVAVPAGQKLNYQLGYVEVKPKKETSDNRDIYTFTFENLESFLEEPPNKNIGQAYVVFSTAPSWENVFPPVAETGPIPVELVKKLESMKSLANAGNEDEFYFKLQTLVSDEIANCKIDTGLNGFAVRKLQEVFDSNYATAIEKAYLLYHLLKHVDIPAEIVALPISGDGQTAPDVPTMLQFDGFLIKIKGKAAGDIYLNPWKNDDFLYPYTKVGATVYNLQEKTFKTLDGTGTCQNRVDISGKIKIGKDNEKTAGELELLVSGYFYPYRSALEDAKKTLLKVIKGVLPVSNLEIKKITLLSPGKLSAVVSVEGDFLKTISAQYLLLEKYQIPYVSEEMISLKERKFPLPLDIPFSTRVNLELEIPGDLEIFFLAPPVEVKNDIGTYEQRAVSPRPGTIILSMAINIEKPVIISQAYPSFKVIVAQYFIKEPLAIAKKKGS
ncbi:MAG TPA: DUF3857 domain-containing protein [Candidatus Kapabacteria bacterium]|nr:DUF3857 domain-containing protein [Candidatus Kapabacteria bacterium]